MRIKMNCEVVVFLEQTQGINIIFETHVNECTLIWSWLLGLRNMINRANRLIKFISDDGESLTLHLSIELGDGEFEVIFDVRLFFRRNVFKIYIWLFFIFFVLASASASIIVVGATSSSFSTSLALVFTPTIIIFWVFTTHLI